MSTAKKGYMTGNTKKGASKKLLEHYLEPAKFLSGHIKFEDYLRCPSTTLLRYAVDAKDAVEYCKKRFVKKKNDEYNKDALESLRHLSVAILPSLMGHFETFQKSIFAGVFEYSRFIPTFNLQGFIPKLKKIQDVNIDVARMAAYRGQPASIGLLFADNLYCWHDPAKVNQLISLFAKTQFYDSQAMEDLRVLWQLRHSIVHTGGWLTRPDAQKVKRLASRGDRPVVFDKNFIWAVSKRMHQVVFESVSRLRDDYKRQISPAVIDFSPEIDQFFAVDSKVKTWLSDASRKLSVSASLVNKTSP